MKRSCGRVAYRTERAARSESRRAGSLGWPAAALPPAFSPHPAHGDSRALRGFLAQLRLSQASGLSIILPIPHREAVVSFTRDLGPQPSTGTVALSASGNMQFDFYLGISQEH